MLFELKAGTFVATARWGLQSPHELVLTPEDTLAAPLALSGPSARHCSITAVQFPPAEPDAALEALVARLGAQAKRFKLLDRGRARFADEVEAPYATVRMEQAGFGGIQRHIFRSDPGILTHLACTAPEDQPRAIDEQLMPVIYSFTPTLAEPLA